MRHRMALFVAVLLASSSYEAQDAASVDAACRAAMPPYYASLLASARGDAESTLRHILLLKSRWDDVLRRAATEAPAWFQHTATGKPVGPSVAAKIESARRRLPGDIAGAHEELESLRGLLREARMARGVRTMDDAVTDYHDAMERLASHVGTPHELTLSAADFVLIREDVRHVRGAWEAIEAFRDFETLAGSRDVRSATARVLTTLASAADRSDGAGTQRAGANLKSRYYDLLAVLSRQS